MHVIVTWIAPVATMIAAIMTASNLGSRVTGYGFALFAVGAVAWITIGATSGQSNLLWSNAFLLLVDIFGVWRWLGRRAQYEKGAEVAFSRSADSDKDTLFPVTRLEGMKVEGEGDRTIATVVEAMMSCRNGKIAYVVVREGGAGTVTDRLHALGWEDMQIHQDRIRTSVDEQELSTRRLLQSDHWPVTKADAIASQAGPDVGE